MPIAMLDAHIRRIVTSPFEPIADSLAGLGVPANALTLGGFATWANLDLTDTTSA